MLVKELNVLKWKKKNVGTYQNVTTPLFSIVVSFYFFFTYQDQHQTITKEL